jgi:5'-nucleotidase / UDP-sugar diphosphatase
MGFYDRNRNRFLFSFFSLLVLGATSIFGQSSPSSHLKTLTILHTNDFHAQLLAKDPGPKGGAANIAAFFKQMRKTHKDVLVLSGGDSVLGSPVSTMFEGKPIFEVMNACGYDAAVVGNHELDYGVKLLMEYRKIAKFPILSANFMMNGKLLMEPTAVIEVNGIKVGLLGVTAQWDTPGVTWVSPEEAIKKYLPALKHRTNVVVLLSHLGSGEDTRMAQSISGIDVIVGGHTHNALEKPVMAGKTIIVQAGKHGQYVGVLELTIDTQAGKVVSHSGRLVSIPVPGLAPDPETKRVVDTWEAKVSKVVDIKIGENPKALEVEEVKARLERVWRDTYRTDFGYQNPGATRSDLPAGKILIRHMWNIMPFDDQLMILDLDRQQITQVLGPVKFKEEKALYTLVTNSDAGPRLAKQFNLPAGRIHPIQVILRDPVIEYIKKHGNLEILAGP